MDFMLLIVQIVYLFLNMGILFGLYRNKIVFNYRIKALNIVSEESRKRIKNIPYIK